jgi:hypothetical protein
LKVRSFSRAMLFSYFFVIPSAASAFFFPFRILCGTADAQSRDLLFA